MTPGARVAAAIEILDRVIAGLPAEQALTGWARGSRFAGSKDRAAVRDHVFGVLRRKRSCAVVGGGADGRRLMLGALRQDGLDLDTLFNGLGHAPRPLEEAERASAGVPNGADALDLPDWCLPRLQATLGADTEVVANSLRTRAELFLRVNLRKGDMDAACSALAADQISVAPHQMSPTALHVTDGTRRVRQSQAYVTGLVEIQDVASQAAADTVPLAAGQRVLDYCAGGGGKALALAGRCDLEIFAHDADPGRLKDLPARAQRAGASIQTVATSRVGDHAPFDVVVADVPCSGSGAWRRQPDAKWRLTEDGLARLCGVQDEILARCAELTAPQGTLAYITCSLFAEENEARIDAFLAQHPAWGIEAQRRFSPLEGGDGLFSTILSRKG